MTTITIGKFRWDVPDYGESSGNVEEPRPHQDQNQNMAQVQVQQQKPKAIIPRQFPSLVYDALRAYPEAFEAVAKAVKEFYDKRVSR